MRRDTGVIGIRILFHILHLYRYILSQQIYRGLATVYFAFYGLNFILSLIISYFMRRERKWPKILHFNKVLVVIPTWPDIALRKLTGDVANHFKLIILLLFYIINIYLSIRVTNKRVNIGLFILLKLFMKTRFNSEGHVCRWRAERAYWAAPPLYKAVRAVTRGQSDHGAREIPCSSVDRKPLRVRADLD